MQLFFQLQLLDIIGYDRCTSSWHQNFDAFDSDKLVVLSSVKLCQALSSLVKVMMVRCKCDHTSVSPTCLES